jgi:hypothetical protein
MNLSKKNYKKVLAGELVKQAEKCKVRECDETRKGYFEAYVDEKKSTFDVLIALVNEEVTEHSCDCNSTVAFCRHKVAVLLFLEKGGNSSGQKMFNMPIKWHWLTELVLLIIYSIQHITCGQA